MKNIRHVFFDLDHTLWDYAKNSAEALKELYSYFGLYKYVSEEKFLQVYDKVNEKIWHQFNDNQIDREVIKTRRFPMILEKLGIEITSNPSELHDFFLSNCSNRREVLPYAHEVLKYLKPKYSMSLITNGSSEAQYPKLKASGLDKYFDDVVISHEVKLRKPQPEIFHLAMERIGAQPTTSVMIGDNPKTDIRGAERVGMNTIFFNPTGNRKSMTAWEIQSLSELLKIL